MTRTPRLDIHWRTSLLSAIARCDTLDALQFLWRRWRTEIEGHAERERIVAEFAKRKGEVK